MKTMEEIRNSIAKKYKYKDWFYLHHKIGGTEMDSYIDEEIQEAISIATIELTNQIAVERKKTEMIASENFKLIERLVELKREILLPAKHSWSAEYNKAIEDFKQLNPGVKFKTQ